MWTTNVNVLLRQRVKRPGGYSRFWAETHEDAVIFEAEPEEEQLLLRSGQTNEAAP